MGLAVDATGDVYVGDTGNNRLRFIAPDGEVISVAGSGQRGFADGVGEMAEFYGPGSVAISPSAIIFVADTGNSVVRKVVRAP